jgi:MscS family membrane protein
MHRLLLRTFLALVLAPWLALVPEAAPRHEQDSETTTEAQHEDPAPDDPLERGSPAGTVEGFLNAARARDYQLAASYLDLTDIPAGERPERGPELARQLKLVMDRLLWVELAELSTSGPGNLEDGLRPDLERIAGKSERDAPSFYLERGPRDPAAGDLVPVWRISSATVARVPDLYDRYGPGALGRILPPTFVEVAVLEIYLWQWLALIVAMVAAYVVGIVVSSVLRRLANPIIRRSKSDLDDQLLDLTIGPLRLTVAVGVFSLIVPILGLTLPAETFFRNTCKVLTICALTWLVLRAIDLFADSIQRRLVARGQDSATYLVPTGTKAIKFALGVLVLLAALQTFGFNISTLIAGLGVGGLAVALALRPTLENIFGGIAVLVDEPVRPGQFCKFGGQVGTVEEVGLRSTRIRTLDRTVITVPNSEFSTLQIENFAKRDRIRLITTLGLRYETTADQLRHVIAELRRMLRGHPKVLPEPFRVRFVNFGAFSLDLEVFLYVDTQDFNEFLAIKEDLFLRMIDVVEASGTGFAFPSSTTYLARDGGLNEEKGKAAEKVVQEWREKGELPYPEFSKEGLEEMKGTLDWPPKGAVKG